MALELGPCQVAFGTAGSETDLGKTLGGVTIKIADDSVDLKSDQYGSSPEDTIITGTTVEVELSLAELGLATIATALGQEVLGATPSVVPGENKVGTSMLAVSQQLVLTKYVSGVPSTALTDVITFPAAAIMSNVELPYDGENQRVLRITLKCFPKSVSANWGTASPNAKVVSYYFGDETVTNA